VRILLSFLLLSMPGCVVSSHCFDDNDCRSGQACSAAGRCEPQRIPAADLGGAPDGRIPIRCPLSGMVKAAGLFCIDVHEASRIDATASSAGANGSKAISRAGVLPWQVSSNGEADRACKAAGKRLCTPAEWQAACQGSGKTVYAYGNSYKKKVCNGIDAFDNWQFHLTPTGSFPDCMNKWGIFDMNGNVWEHTAGGNGMTIRGGAFNCSDSRTLHRCDYVPGNWTPTAQGFRCCANGVPGTIDAGALDLASGH
jgi:formylglycine-generating enzyme